jgi:hypothetical protein
MTTRLTHEEHEEEEKKKKMPVGFIFSSSLISIPFPKKMSEKIGTISFHVTPYIS